jgi:adenylate cyclase
MSSIAYQSDNLSGNTGGEAWSVRVDNNGQRYLVVEQPRHNNLRGHESKSPSRNVNNGSSSPSSSSSPGRMNSLTQSKVESSSDVQWCKDQIRVLSNQIGNAGTRSELNDLNMYFTEWKNAKTSSLRERQARRIRSRFVKEATLFCSDMSGFSRICKAEGILHFLALLKTMQSIMLPILESHGGELVKVAADNLFVVFDSPTAAMEATFKCFAAAKAYSKGRTKNNSIQISAGLATGPMWIVRGVDVFGNTANMAFALGQISAGLATGPVWIGNTANMAFELGENMAPKELLVDETVARANANDRRYVFDWRQDEVIGQHTRYAKVSANGDLETVFPQNPDPNVPPVVNPPINSEEPNDFVKMIENRQKATTPYAIKVADEAMNQRFVKKKAVLVIEMFEQAEVAHEAGVLPFIDMVLSMKRHCGMAVKHRHGKCVRSIETKIVGQIMALFDRPIDCMRAAIEARYRCREEDFQLSIGAGFTDILDLDACNAFGDAVNMAFKLGEDVAVAGEILITDNIKNGLSADEFDFKMNDKRSVSLSGIEIIHYNVEYDDWKAEELVEAMERENVEASQSTPQKGKRTEY